MQRYLDRLSLTDVPSGAMGIAVLQEAHMRAIPFENIDPLLGIVPSLDPGDLVEKLIVRRRGGYCYEQNAIFGRALEALGYAPRVLLARVRNGASEGGARSHQAFVVEAGGEAWLADVGFGGHGPLTPLRLDERGPQQTANGTYRIWRDGRSGETVVDRRAGEDWISLYGFDGQTVRDIDLRAANFLSACWPAAPFSANLMVAAYGPSGRTAIFNRALTHGLPPAIETRIMTSVADLSSALSAEVGLDLDADAIEGIWKKISEAPTKR